LNLLERLVLKHQKSICHSHRSDKPKMVFREFGLVSEEGPCALADSEHKQTFSFLHSLTCTPYDSGAYREYIPAYSFLVSLASSKCIEYLNNYILFQCSVSSLQRDIKIYHQRNQCSNLISWVVAPHIKYQRFATTCYEKQFQPLFNILNYLLFDFLRELSENSEFKGIEKVSLKEPTYHLIFPQSIVRVAEESLTVNYYQWQPVKA